jgi:transposase
MMIYATPQGEHAHSELQYELKQAESAKWYRRLKIIQLSMSGISASQLSQQFDLCPATIRSYIKAYNGKGIENLRPRKQPGRPTKVGHLSRDEWSKILSQTPNQYEKLETDSRQWTLELLAGYAKEYLNQPVTLDTISKALRRCKYRTGRAKLRIGSPDPDYSVKRETVETLASLPPRGN